MLHNKMADKDGSKKKTVFAAYKEQLIRYPIAINAVQSALIALIAGIVSQSLRNVKVYDYQEIWVMMLIGAAHNTPILLWFSRLMQSSKVSLLTNLLIDQLIFSPLFTASIISMRHFLKGGDLADIPMVVWTIVPAAQTTSWLYWFPVRFLILRYVPVIYHLLAANIGSLLWNIIFSFLINS